ncbi:MAG: hypothetical protein BGO55_00510 [Sphingobacteriales bacterium 50-39]|nr:hypothetical protein [Sphingobacteriales bacterium]OJW53596.1 MAG: hypothetical protein BGO55_00510 [Sphingobacteriales bacterium 50-39]
MADFEIAYKATIRVERGYANNPNDTGGETYGGVSRNNWPQWSGWKIIDELKGKPGFGAALQANKDLQAAMRGFYQVNFWDVLRLNQVQDQPIANELFDLAVNCSSKIAALFLQRSLNVLNKQGKFYPDIVVDGVVGAGTLNALAKANQKDVLKCIVALQGARYIGIAENRASQEEFMAGWIRRAFGQFSLTA